MTKELSKGLSKCCLGHGQILYRSKGHGYLVSDQLSREWSQFVCTNDKGCGGGCRVFSGEASICFLCASRSPEGRQTIVTSSGGRIPWQKAFLQSPCLSPRQQCTARLTRKRRLSNQRTGEKQSLFDQSWHSQFPKTTILDLAWSGMSCLSFFIVRTHIVGIAFGVPFSRNALYSPRVRCLNVPSSSISFFSS